MIVVNFKAYKKATGDKAEKISKEISEAGEEESVEAVSCPQHIDLRQCTGKVFAQHMDSVDPGSHTGSVTAEALKDAGVSGVLLNHSENRMEKKKIRRSVDKARSAGLKTIVCGQSPEECRELSRLNPDYVGFEPPELIGGDVSVSEAKPELIEKAVEESETEVLAGAGIKTREDVEKSKKLGCSGILVASGVIKSENPKESLKELASGL